MSDVHAASASVAAASATRVGPGALRMAGIPDERRTRRRLDRGVVEAYRRRWDLADVASSAAELRGPHGDDDDTRTAWAALRGVLDPAPDSR